MLIEKKKTHILDDVRIKASRHIEIITVSEVMFVSNELALELKKKCSCR